MDWTNEDAWSVLKIVLAALLGFLGYAMLAWLKKQLDRLLRWILT